MPLQAAQGCIFSAVQRQKGSMFYINPDYQMQQIVFHGLSLVIGNQPAILLYIAATVFGAFLLLLLWRLIFTFLPR